MQQKPPGEWVAVTGSSGFIGRRVAAELLERGYGVIPLDLPERDVRHPLDLGSMDPQPSAVVHLAGRLGTHELFDDAPGAITTNMIGTANVLEACRRGGASYVGITMPDAFPSIYTATKVGATRLERAYHHAYGLQVCRVRAFNAYGPAQKHGAGHPQKILPTFATEAWAGRPIPIWGDGRQTVDLVHVDDLARMLVDALPHGEDRTFDGGTGHPLTVREVAQMVLDITGSTAGVRHEPMRRGELPGTGVVALGEGWPLLTQVPKFDPAQFEAAVLSYRPTP